MFDLSRIVYRLVSRKLKEFPKLEKERKRPGAGAKDKEEGDTGDADAKHKEEAADADDDLIRKRLRFVIW